MSTPQPDEPQHSALVDEKRDDLTLVRAVAARDSHAFELLYHRYAHRLLTYLTRRLSERDLAEEVLHEVMLVLWRKAAHFDPKCQLAPWLFGIARRESHTVWRKVQRSLVSSSTGDMAASPEETLLHDEHRWAITTALGNLPRIEKEVVELTYYHGFSYRDIATIVGCPVNTVKTRMARARRRLAPHLAELT